MRKLIILLSVALLWGCASLEKKHFKAVKFFNENPVLAAEYCSGKFPVEEKIIFGDPVIKTDTVKRTIKIPCPDPSPENNFKPSVDCENQTIYTTTTRTITKTLTNTAKIKVLENERDTVKEKYLQEKIRADNAEKERDKANKEFNQLLYTVLSALGLVALFFIIKLIR